MALERSRVGRSRGFWSWLWIVGILWAATAGAEDRATGSFEGKNWSFDLGSAYAFPGDELLGDGRGILLAITNAHLNRPYLDDWKDKQWVLDHLIADTSSENPTLVVYLGFDTKGALEGLSWYFGSGDGCGFCSYSAIQSTVKIAGGRLVGTVKGRDDEIAIDLDLDIPVQPEAPGKKTGLDSEGAKAFLAFHAQLVSTEHAGLWDRLDSEWHEILAEHTPEELEGWYANLANDRLPPEVTLEEAYRIGDRVLVIFEGKASYGGKVRGEARMDLEDGAWKYDDAWFDAVLE